MKAYLKYHDNQNSNRATDDWGTPGAPTLIIRVLYTAGRSFASPFNPQTDIGGR